MLDSAILTCREEYTRHFVRLGYLMGWDDHAANKDFAAESVALQLIPKDDHADLVALAVQGHLERKFGVDANGRVKATPEQISNTVIHLFINT